jgi:2-dehydropantoate 2-reductase
VKIVVAGAGAIGGYVGARLALCGEDVTFIVRGGNLDAIRRNGITLLAHDGTREVARNVHATGDYAEAGPQDVVVLAMKAHQLGSVSAQVPKLFGAGTVAVTMQNGLPYWYFHRHGGALAGSVLRSVDPDGAIARDIPPERVVGCVVYPASELVAPGVVRHVEGERLPLGELDGRSSERVMRIAAAAACPRALPSRRPARTGCCGHRMPVDTSAVVEVFYPTHKILPIGAETA